MNQTQSPRWEISSSQAGWLAAGVVSITGHGLAANLIMQAGGRDAWMCGLVAIPLAAVGLGAIYKLARIFPGKTIMEYLPQIFGYAGYPVGLLYPLFWLTTVVFTLRITTDWLVDSILPETPSWVMSIMYMAVVLYSALGGLDVLARINTFTVPLLSVFGLTVSFGTLGSKDYRLLLPFFEHGFSPVLGAAFLALGFFGEMSVAAALSAYVRPRERPKLLKSYLLAMLYVGITTAGPIAGAMSTLGYRLAQTMPYPTYQHWLMVSIARFFERTDLLVVHQWLAGAYVRSGLFLLLSADAFTRLTGTQKHLNRVLFGLGLLAIVLGEIAFSNKLFFDRFIRYVYMPTGVVLGILLPPLFLGVARLRGFQRRNTGWSPPA